MWHGFLFRLHLQLLLNSAAPLLCGASHVEWARALLCKPPFPCDCISCNVLLYTAADLHCCRTVAAIANDPDFHLDLQLQPGDIEIIHNPSTFHSRTKVIDGKVRLENTDDNGAHTSAVLALSGIFLARVLLKHVQFLSG
jgi:hypothetical protein